LTGLGVRDDPPQWHTQPVRHSRLATLLADEFGAAHAATIRQDHVLAALGGQTADQALRRGISPRIIWEAICADFDVPSQRRLGRDRPDAQPSSD
jgi:hypothetical protein